MRIHYLQHVPFEGPATIAQWAAGKGHTQARTRLYESDPLPQPDEFDCLIVMGGPMGAADLREYPWLADEHKCLCAALDADKAMLGICLGAQLIAAALGARVYANTEMEIGWYPVTETPDCDSTAYSGFLGGELPVLHWHGDTFELPHGSVHLARSVACEQQAFSYGECVIGLQFHLEMAREHASTIIDVSAAELRTAGTYIQSSGEILEVTECFSQANIAMEDLLGRISTRVEQLI